MNGVLVKFLVELPSGRDPENYIGLPLHGKRHEKIGEIEGVEAGPGGFKFIARVLPEHAKAIDGSFIRFATTEKKS